MTGGLTGYLIGSMSSHFDSWATTNGVQVAWENRAFTPPSVDGDIPWARVTFFPAETQQAGCGDDGLNKMGGIMLVNIFCRKNASAGVANNLTDSLLSHFKRGTNTPQVSGYYARIFNVWRDAALPDERWFMVPVRIRYYQHVINI